MSGGNTYIIGEVKNTTSTSLSIPRVRVAINGGTATAFEVYSPNTGLLSDTFFTFVLPPNGVGFFRAGPFTGVSTYTITGEAQPLVTVSPMRTSLAVTGTLDQGGINYSLTVTNQGVAAIAYNIQAYVAGHGGTPVSIQDVDPSRLGGTAGGLCATDRLAPGGAPGVISGSFDRAISNINLVALKWDEIAVEPIAFNAAGVGGAGSLRVISACSWTAVSNNNWITVTSGASGSGNGSVSIQVSANPTTTMRTGTLTVAGLSVRIEQAAGTTTPFTDPNLTSQVTPIKRLHITELRGRVDAVRSRFGLPPYSWTDPTVTSGSTPVRVSHITDLRTALAQVYAAAQRTAPTYTDPTLTAGVTPVKAAHILELRSALVAIE